jgi:hypothetical protein
VSNWWGRVLNMVCRDDPAAADRPELRAAFSAISTLQQFVADANDVINAPARPNSVGHPADIDGDALLRFYDEQLPQLTSLLRTAAEALAAVIGAPEASGVVRVLDLTLRAEVLTATMSWGVDPVEWPIFQDHRLTPGQPPVLPEIERYAKTGHLEGSTPEAADRAPEAGSPQLPPWPANKLYGLRWWHFGAFATRAGREHDWVWGRVDGATALAGILIGTDPDARALTVDLVDAILAEEFGDGDVAANRRRLLEQTDHARRATTDDLIAQMESEEPGTVDHLKDTVVGLAASIPVATIRPWVVAALGHGNQAGAPTRVGLRAVYYALRTWGARRIDRELREWLKLPPRPTPWQQRTARLRGLVSRSVPRR